jgi:uncharacterized lipoprotein YddW (UPF0748 family)
MSLCSSCLCRGTLAYLAAAVFAAVSLQAQTVIVDNTDASPAYTENGTWTTGTDTQDYGANYRYRSTSTSSSRYVQWQPNLPVAGNYSVSVWYPAGPSRPSDAQYTVYYNGGASQTFTVDQKANGGQWVLLGTYNFPAGSTSNGRVRLSAKSVQSNTLVAADAVKFSQSQVPVSLTMAVSPAGIGSTTPAAGASYNYYSGDLVPITATPVAGYRFDHWAVSAGSNVVAPTSASTNVAMDVSKTVTAFFTASKPEFRAFWADVFHPGFQSQAEVDAMISLAVQGRYNAIIAEVLAYHDTTGGTHGAYWRSNVVPRSSAVSDSFDPLGYLVEQAHASGIEVHPWLVTFRVSTAWPPSGNAYLAARPQWFMTTAASVGTMASVGGYYVLDPGCPEVQDYLASIVRELVTNYEVDGIHWDYIRYTQADAGYPTDTAYTNSTLARFHRVTGRSDIPASTDSAWSDFRRRGVTELVRRVRAEIPTIPNVRQPIRYSASLVTWSPASSNFHLTRPYYDCYCDWEYWMSKGYLDASVPMSYFDENGAYQQTYRDWVNNSVTWAYDRHTFIGPGIYMNTFDNSVIQLEYARSAGAHGYSTYSYNVTNSVGSQWDDWYPYVASNFFTEAAATPAMPWRNQATAVEGTLYGRVLDGGGNPVDDAAVQVGSTSVVQTDGNGYYVATLVPATASGTGYSVTATKTGLPSTTLPSVSVVAGTVARQDIVLSNRPYITQQPQGQQVCAAAGATFTVQATGDGTLSYNWQKDGVDLADGGDISGSSSTTLQIANVEPADLGGYACQVTDSRGTTASDGASLSIKAPASIVQEPQPQNVQLGGTATFSVSATGGGVLNYQWQKNGQNVNGNGHITGVLTATLTIQSVMIADLGQYRCLVSSDCGSTVSGSALLSLSVIPGDFDADGDVDQQDFGHMQACMSGSMVAQAAPECANARFDGDSDVDQDDLSMFLSCLSGPGTQASASCLD